MFLGPIAQRQSAGLIIPWLQVRILLGPLPSGVVTALQPFAEACIFKGSRHVPLSPLSRSGFSGVATSSGPRALEGTKGQMHGNLMKRDSVGVKSRPGLF